MRTAIEAIHDDIAAIVELIGEALGCNAAHDRGGHPDRIDDRVLAVLTSKGALHRANDIAMLARNRIHMGGGVRVVECRSCA